MARTFNGVDARLECASALISTMPFTFDAWVWLDSLPGDQAVISISRSPSAGDFSFFELCVISTGAVRARMGAASGTAQAATSSTTFAAGSGWHHACAVFTSTTSRAAYLDGGGKGTNASNPGALNTLTATTLGARHTNATFDQFLNGKIAFPTIRNVALSDNEVALLATGISGNLVRPETIVDLLPLSVGGIEWGGRNAFMPTGGVGRANDPPKVQVYDPPWEFIFGRILGAVPPPNTGMFFSA